MAEVKLEQAGLNVGGWKWWRRSLLEDGGPRSKSTIDRRAHP